MNIFPKFLIIVLVPTALSFIIHLSSQQGAVQAKNKTEINIESELNDDDGIEDENEDEGKTDNSVSIKTQSSINSENSVKIENDKFEIKGALGSVSSGSFTVNGQSISIDPALVKSYRQKGILEVGLDVSVKGIIKNSVLYAQEVKVMPVRPSSGENAPGNFKLDVKNKNPNPSISINPSVTGTQTATLTANVKIKAKGSVDQVVQFLNQILNFLQNLF